MKETAARLVSLLRASDMVARSGGDEFALILSGTHDEDAIARVARKLLTAMHRPYHVDGGQAHSSASIGIAMFPEHAIDGGQLFMCADTALAIAKKSGRNRWHFYQPGGVEKVSQRLVLEEHMYDAIQNGEFEMHYQPICDATTRELVGVEALMRWHRPGEGFISPAEFIPLAERNGLIDFLAACRT